MKREHKLKDSVEVWKNKVNDGIAKEQLVKYLDLLKGILY